jgi:DNA mismatch repair protein MutL
MAGRPGIGPRVIGQFRNTYILCQTEDGLLIVDQHAAHERVVYETLKRSLNAENMEVQGLLVPYHVELSLVDARTAREKGSRLAELGLELDHFGGNTFLLRSVPVLLKDAPWDAFLPELLAEMRKHDPDKDALVDSALTVMACHGAIRAGKSMSFEEMQLLLEQLEEMALPTNCPHGRPAFRRFSIKELEKMFKRVV